VLQRKRYEARRFHNPYFQREKRRHWIGIAVVGLALALVAGGIIFVLAARRFSVTSVSVTGNETIPGDQITARAWEELNRRRLVFFKASSRFLYDEDKLRGALSSAYAFESLDITAACQWFGPGECSIAVAVKEKTSQLLWKSEEQMYLADLNGSVIRELTPQEIESLSAPEPPPLVRLPVFEDVNGAPVPIGQQVLTQQEVASAFLFHDRLRELDIAFGNTRIDRLAGKWFAVRTATAYDILFDAAGDAEAQARHLEVLLRDTIADQGKLEYIDLRFGDHVYYK
jgi:hypothetical protein